MRVRYAAAGRHFQRHARLYRGDSVVIGVPVAHDEAGIAPLVVKDIAQKMLIFTGIFTVDAVIARHEALDAALLDGDLKRGEVYFAQRPFIQHGIDRHAVQLLRVCGIVLDAGIHAL